MNKNSKIQHRYADFHMDEHGVLTIYVASNIFLEVADIRELLNIHGEFTNQQKCPCVMVLGKYTSLSSEGRKFLATNEAVQYSLCEAFVIQSLSQKIVGNFYLRIDKPGVPTRLFSTEKEAYKWAKGFLKSK